METCESRIVLAESNENMTEKKRKPKKPGIVYLSTVPFGMTVTSIKNTFSKFGKVTRAFFQLANMENYVGRVNGGSYHKEQNNKPKRKGLVKGRVRYSEGWVEFESKRRAKWIAEMLNNTPVGGKKSSPYYDCLWSIKYLGKTFSWEELGKRILFEKELYRRKMANEVRKISEEADKYIKAAEIVERIEKKGKTTNNSSSNTKNIDIKQVGIKQRLTEEEIVKKQQEKRLKDLKYKTKLMKSKQKKRERRADKLQMRKEKAKSLNVFSAS